MSDETAADDFQTLLQRVQQGSAEAARELYETYSGHVLRGVRSRLWHRVRSKYDSQDFAQQVWASFFDDFGGLPHFDSPEALVSYLLGMAINKVKDGGRDLLTQQRDILREERFDGAEGAGGPHLVSREPTPSAHAMYEEQRDRLIDRQPLKIRSVVELRMAGWTFEEIGAELGIDERTARRIIKDLEKEHDAAPVAGARGAAWQLSERGVRS